MVLVQDWARCHPTAAAMIQRLKDYQIPFWGKGEWPPNLPDLNPIENLWPILEEEMKSARQRPKNIDYVPSSQLLEEDKAGNPNELGCFNDKPCQRRK